MKIVALTPVKNEEWILPTYISSMNKIADEIIILDDNSTDRTSEILKNENITVIVPQISDKVNMSQKRLLLLEEGRKRGGTHFIWLDTDESFDSNFLQYGKEIITKLEPGQKITLPWITLWKSIEQERIDGVWKENFKDVIVCDIPEYTFQNKDLSEGRTQGPNDKVIHLKRDQGTILHFQFLNFEDVQAKQAWYRCIELLQSKRSARKINNMYAIGLDTSDVKVEKTPSEWFTSITLPHQESNKKKWYIEDMVRMFNERNILTFEPLQIWHIRDLKKMFIEKIGRSPKSRTFPSWIIKLNNVKNIIKNTCLKK